MHYAIDSHQSIRRSADTQTPIKASMVSVLFQKLTGRFASLRTRSFTAILCLWCNGVLIVFTDFLLLIYFRTTYLTLISPKLGVFRSLSAPAILITVLFPPSFSLCLYINSQFLYLSYIPLSSLQTRNYVRLLRQSHLTHLNLFACLKDTENMIFSETKLIIGSDVTRFAINLSPEALFQRLKIASSTWKSSSTSDDAIGSPMSVSICSSLSSSSTYCREKSKIRTRKSYVAK